MNNLNVNGTTLFSNNATCNSSLNIAGRTILGSDVYNCIDSIFEVSRNLIVRKNVASSSGDSKQFNGGSMTSPSSITLAENNNITIKSRNSITEILQSH